MMDLEQKTLLVDSVSKSTLDLDHCESISCVTVLKNDDCPGHVTRNIITS